MRETLEAVLPTNVASRVLFDALRKLPRAPRSSEDVRTLTFELLPTALDKHADEDAAEAVTQRLSWFFEHGPASQPPPPAPSAADADTDADAHLDVDVDLSDDGDTVTKAMPTSLLEPVPVVVMSAGEHLAYCLEAALGFARVSVWTVPGVAELRHAVFARAPLIVLLDAVEPAGEWDGVLGVLKGVPDSTVAVLWGADADFVQPVRDHLQSRTHSVLLSRTEGLGPVLDLVASRHRSE